MKSRSMAGWLAAVLLACSWAVAAQAETYYVDAGEGADSADGRSAQSAWRTVAKVNATPLSSGDTVLFRRGRVWREGLVIRASGAPGAPVTYAAYGDGAPPELNGADPVSGWRLRSGDVYQADLPANVSQVFLDGTRLIRARWPNEGWAPISAEDTNGVSVHSESLTQPDGYWTGARAVIKTANFALEGHRVQEYAAGALLLERKVGRWIRKGYGFYLEGKLEELDAPGEWVCQDGRLYLHMAPGEHPAKHVIEGTRRHTGVAFATDNRHIIVRDLAIAHFNGAGVRGENVQDIRLESLDIKGSGGCGIAMQSEPRNSHGEWVIRDNRVREAMNDGIRIAGCNRGEISGNTITELASDPRAPGSSIAIIFKGDDVCVTSNTIDRVCGVGIFAHTGKNCTISHNTITRAMLQNHDGGGIYLGWTQENLCILHNTVSDIEGTVAGTPYKYPWSITGIYLDAGPCDTTVAGNLVSNCRGDGCFVHMHGHHNTIINNVFYGNGCGINLAEKRPDAIHDHIIRNNILYADKGRCTLRLKRHEESKAPMAVYDHNLHFCPATNAVIRYRAPGQAEQRLTVSEWQAVSGQAHGSLFADPRLADAPNGDFRLQPDSPCIDAGTDTGLKHDFLDYPIPSGAAPDIGAFEFSSALPANGR
ncbi:MAG: right-handed parallel beta-helix repeat-containing protein [Kiritimatiellae bacterium]|nr:right-handed parallel beta-helix repeat-containing protein [Kiritimatiellia bacterium]